MLYTAFVRRWLANIVSDVWNAISLRRIGIALFSLVLIGVAIFFVEASVRSWRIQKAASLSCGTPLDTSRPLAYVQYNINEDSTESLFRGAVFISLGDVGTGPETVEVLFSGASGYGNSTTHIHLFRDEPNKTFWARKPEDVEYVRQTGSPQDFPFDSTMIDFNTKFTPSVPLQGFMVRNFNPSFYLPCGQFRWTTVSSDTLNLHFEMRRNPLVQLMAVVIFLVAALFTFIIPFTVRPESLPTAVASFFFSVWSTRGILSSEMKVFPTRFDLGILFLCVLLLILIGVRILYWWTRRRGI